MKVKVNDMDDLQTETGEWAERNFPQSTIESCSEHLRREVEEFRKSGYVSGGWDAEELADCQLLLFHIAHKMGVRLELESRKKLAKNQARKWGHPDALGVVEHIR